MPKFEQNSAYKKIPIEEIDFGTNVRHTHKDEDIPNLAESIRKNGLIQPLVVRPTENHTGGICYEIVAGHRRFEAIRFLQSRGNDFNLVPCVIQTSGKLKTLQMVENIQRKDLTQLEKEEAVKEMLDSGMTAKQIADEFSKQISWVTDIIAGMNVRNEAESAGVDTSKIGTRALAQLRSIPKEEQPQAVEKLSEAGGTNKAATEIMHEYKGDENEFVEEPEFDESDEVFERFEKEALDEYELPTAHVSSKSEAYEDVLVHIKSSTCAWLENICQEKRYIGFGMAIDHIVSIAKKRKLI